MDKKVLPYTSPLIITYPDYTNLMFAFGRYPEVNKWLLTKMIGMFGLWTPETYGILVNFCDAANPWHCTPADACPYIATQYIDNSLLLEDIQDMIAFICSQIDKGYYISLYTDYYYLSCSGECNKTHYEHDLLIYGYDKGQTQLYIAGFINGKGFEQYTVPMQDIQLGFRNLKVFRSQRVNMYRYNSNNDLVKGTDYCSFMFDYQLSELYLHNEVLQYLDETRYPKSEKVYWGIEVYELYKKYCNYLAETKDIDVFKQALQVFYSHKIVIKYICSDLCRNKLIESDLDKKLFEFVSKHLAIRNSILKYQLANQLHKAVQVLPKLDQLQAVERDLLTIAIAKIP